MSGKKLTTPLLFNPSLQEVKLAAAKTGLPELEAEKFWNHYEMVGWKCGRGLRITSWTHALAGWKLRWMERGGCMPQAKQLPMDKQLDRLLSDVRADRRWQ